MKTTLPLQVLSGQSSAKTTTKFHLLEEDGDEGRKKLQPTSWRVTVTVGCVAACLILSLNVVVFILSVVGTFKSNVSEASYGYHAFPVLYSGKCDVSKRIGTWLHLLINVLGSILLSVSNSCAQLLSAPTGEDVTKAHAKGRWMDIGVPSLRNLRQISRWRTFCWVVLMVSSVPLHLFYNSVIINNFSATEYQSVLVTDAFLTGGWWNATGIDAAVEYDANGPVPAYNSSRISRLQAMVNHTTQSSLQKLSNEDCLKAYGSSAWESGWGDVLVISSATQLDNVLDIQKHIPSHENSWICGGDGPCSNFTQILADADNWIVGYPVDAWEPFPSEYKWTPVQYCLAQPLPQNCDVILSNDTLIFVIIANFFKVVVMATLIFTKFQPLVTVGDAIAWFMSHPDSEMEGRGPLSFHDVNKASSRRAVEGYDGLRTSVFLDRKRRWRDAVGNSRWWVCLTICLLVWLAALAFFIAALIRARWFRTSAFGNLDQGELGAFDNDSTLTLSDSVFANSLLTNAPQVAITFMYIFYNNALTSMLLSHEYAGYAVQRKALRTSRRVGLQRSSYFLQIPYRYGLPLIASMSILHWIVSNSIFLLEVVIVNYDGSDDYELSTSAAGYSAVWIVPGLVVGAVLIAVLVILSRRRLDRGIPLAGSCSLAIAAACANAEETDGHLMPVQYGVLTTRERDDCGREYVGFSSRDVRPLVSEVEYR